MARGGITRAIGMAAALVALSACEIRREDAAEEPAPPAPDYSLEAKDGAVIKTIATPEGRATLRSGERVPLALPAGFSLYPDAEIVRNSVAERGGEGATLVEFTSEVQPQAVADFYRREAEAAGYDVEVDLSVDDGHVVAGRDEAGRRFSVSTFAAGAGTEASLTFRGGA